MEQNQKALYFEYVLHKLLAWYQGGANIAANDFSILKSVKLLFFVSAAGGNKEQNQLLEEVFDNFVAMPYGHVESDIYNQIKINQGLLTFYQIDNNRTQVRNTYSDEGLDHLIKNSIDQSIRYLMSVNPALIRMSSFDLVNLSHAWYSWQKYYNLAKQYGNRSISIPSEVIKREDKIYSLNTF